MLRSSSVGGQVDLEDKLDFGMPLGVTAAFHGRLVGCDGLKTVLFLQGSRGLIQDASPPPRSFSRWF
eukprot:149758-Karenia_brevis.AAC.1